MGNRLGRIVDHHRSLLATIVLMVMSHVLPVQAVVPFLACTRVALRGPAQARKDEADEEQQMEQESAHGRECTAPSTADGGPSGPSPGEAKGSDQGAVQEICAPDSMTAARRCSIPRPWKHSRAKAAGIVKKWTGSGPAPAMAPLFVRT